MSIESIDLQRSVASLNIKLINQGILKGEVSLYC